MIKKFLVKNNNKKIKSNFNMSESFNKKEDYKKVFTKWDIVLAIAIILLTSFGTFLVGENQNTGAVVVIEKDGEIFGEYSLLEDQTIIIDKEKDSEKITDGENYVDKSRKEECNILEIKNGRVKMVDANCPDKYCIEHKEIYYTNESIICLPNKVIVTIKGKDESEQRENKVDVVVN